MIVELQNRSRHTGASTPASQDGWETAKRLREAGVGVAMIKEALRIATCSLPPQGGYASRRHA